MTIPTDPGTNESDGRREERGRRRRRLRRLRKPALLVGIPVVVFIAVLWIAVAYTQRSSFCAHACHEMEPYAATWEDSAHKNVACVRCHTQPGVLGFVDAQVQGLRELYVHIRGEEKTPIVYTEHMPNSTCTAAGCHSAQPLTNPIDLHSATAPAAPAVTFSHGAHAMVPLCVDCHSQVVHTTVPGRPYVDPASMAFCLRCHNGTQASDACRLCHATRSPTAGAAAP